jgi:hypothetical protein
MRRFYFAASLALAVLTVLGLSGPAAAGEQVPFKGSMEGMRLSNTPLAPPFVLNTTAITGNATQLGEYRLVITSIVNTREMTATVAYVFVAANGDTLTAEGTGKNTPTETPGVILLVGNATITGGTGRFAGATGSFRVERLGDLATGLTIGAFEGTISSPGN